MCNIVLNNSEKFWIWESVKNDFETMTDCNGYVLDRKEVKELLARMVRGGWNR